jgi:hypothetical protein
VAKCPQRVSLGLLAPEDEGTTILRNVAVYQPTPRYIQDDLNLQYRVEFACNFTTGHGSGVAQYKMYCHFPFDLNYFWSEVTSLVPDVLTSCEIATEGGGGV